MKSLAVLLVLLFPLSLAARADEASQRAKAQELVNVLHTDRMVQQVATGIHKQFSDAAEHVVGSNATPDQTKQITDFETKLSQTIDAQMNWHVVGPAFVDLYAKNFTESELDAIIAFYKSPAGIAFLEKTPALNAQITQLLQSEIATLRPQLNQSLDDFRKAQAAASSANSNNLQLTSPGPAAH